ncbi:BON domain-containing protein [Pseudanabaena mucicola]|uniref:BON domain-containing protein n=1 Tax=Pseudanabaena mucicola FACHB-723 TaxID=2692860 RepID=A0ABR8A1R5_9CYAN|nr:BON domain-containing protein [Pseudanabaena mucicola]MBD2189963.1 BON domain-containing protein [Pseudanabaena mucicola FACHB-723]
MNKKIASLLLTSSLMVTVVSCTDARTTSEAPAPNVNYSTSSPTASPQNTQAAVDDAQDETRKRQLESDIRAREQRNDATGDSTNRPDTDLASEVRSKLEANIPKGNLTIESKDANIVVSGTVPLLDDLTKIKSLAMEIKGVKTVTIKATVAS